AKTRGGVDEAALWRGLSPRQASRLRRRLLRRQDDRVAAGDSRNLRAAHLLGGWRRALGAKRRLDRASRHGRDHRAELLQAEDHLRAANVLDALDRGAFTMKVGRAIRSGVVGEGFSGI